MNVHSKKNGVNGYENVFPWEIKDVEAKLSEELMSYFKGERTSFVQVGPKKYFFPNRYKQEAQKIYNMEVRPTDIFVASYPRSGTTWTQELVWMVAKNLDYAGSDAVPLTERYPFLEFCMCVHPALMEEFKQENSHNEENIKLLDWVTQPGHEQISQIPSPRFIKTHMPISLLPPDLLNVGKMVYVARDPRDVVVSFYHLNKSMRTQGYVGDFKTFWNYFYRGLHHWAPYFEHVKEAWAMRNHPNMLFLFYEELAKDLPAAVKKVSKFLGKKFTEEEILKLCDHLSIEAFKTNKSVNYDVMKILGIMLAGQEFIRKGKAGGWRDYFDEEMSQQASQWIADNLKDTDFKFPHLNGHNKEERQENHN